MTYTELTDLQPVMKDCFWAFSNKQVAEGIEAHKLEGKELFNGGAGLIGTKEGIKEFLGFFDQIAKRISEECTPQEVYDFEFWDHESEYTGDDSIACSIVEHYFGEEKAKQIVRKL